MTVLFAYEACTFLFSMQVDQRLNVISEPRERRMDKIMVHVCFALICFAREQNSWKSGLFRPREGLTRVQESR